MSRTIPLRDFQIHIAFHESEYFSVSTAQINYDEYPPPLRVHNGKVTAEPGPPLEVGSSRDVPIEVFESARVSNIGNLSLDRAVLRHAMGVFTSQILSSDSAAGLYEFLYKLRTESSQGSGLGRITVSYDEPMLDGIPWELLWTATENSQDQPRCPVMRRYLAPARERTGDIDLPINVLLESVTRKVEEDEIPNWGKELFDGFTRYARDEKGIDWGTSKEISKAGEVRHVLFDSEDEESVEELQRKIEVMAGPVTSQSIPPRLFVLHNIATNAPAFLNTRLVRDGLAAGADSVLLVTPNSLEADAGRFFPIFYRKLMHNEPLDQAVWQAYEDSWATPSEVSYVLSAREGGEFGLLLTGAVLEAALAEPVVKKPARRSPTRGRSRRSPIGFGGSHSKSLPPITSAEPPILLPTSQRASRIKTELISETRSKTAVLTNNMVSAVNARLPGITFDQEIHGVGQVVDLRRSISETKQVTMAAAILLDELETEDVETLFRLTNIWITDETVTPSRNLTNSDPLIKLKPYDLHLQIGPPREGAIVSEAFNEESLKQVFEKQTEVDLDVMFFTTDKDFKIEVPNTVSTVNNPDPNSHNGVHVKMRLPKFGSSDEVHIKITPLNFGQRRLRTCIYYGNVMLQSVLLKAVVVNEATEIPKDLPREMAITSHTTDYVASVDYALLNELPQPSLNLFTNHDATGTHWIGAFSSGDTSAFQLTSGSMRTFDDATLNNNAENIRAILMKIEGESSYKFGAALPVDDQDIARREGYFRELAIRGWRLFHPLFVVDGGDDADNAQRLQEFRNTTKDSHIVSIARCGKNSATIPWAALYSNSIDPGKSDDIKLCEIFKKQLAANKWTGTELTEKHDLLDDPKACRSQPHCPLNTDKKKLTVCPFGFWGYLHQVEQPLQAVNPTPVGEIPEELSDYDFGQTSFINCSTKDQVKVGMGAYPGIPDVVPHSDEIRLLKKNPAVDFEYSDERDAILKMLETGGQHFYYFYCHGDINQAEKLFRLKVGPLQKPGYIESASLVPEDISWQVPKPLFIMNGCETMAVTPDLTHGFLHTLKRLGAAGVVGTEIKVWTQLARPFGVRLLSNMFQGMSVGEAFLEVRKYLLRQLNPLGLVYSYYAPATLHLHDPDDCEWCKNHTHAV